MAELVQISEVEMKELQERAKTLEPDNKKKSFRQAVFSLYPMIKDAIDKGMTRHEVYDQLLPDNLKAKIALSTFMSYYHAAKKAAEAAEKEAAAKARKEAKNADASITPPSPPVIDKPKSSQAVQKAMETVRPKTANNSSTAINIHPDTKDL